MIIFGWGFQTIKNFGPAFRRLCDHCHNEDYWILTRIMTWFTLFFIPIFPYEVKHHLACPVCKYGFVLNGDQVSKIKPIAEANQLFIDGKITKEEYQVKLGEPTGSSEPEAISEAVEVGTLPEGTQVALSYCASCGGKVTEELRFCGSCGTAVKK
jgi:hypothetical protein